MDKEEFWVFINQFVAYFKIPNVCHDEPHKAPAHKAPAKKAPPKKAASDCDPHTYPYEGQMVESNEVRGKVYLVMLCKKRWIQNPPTLNGIFKSWKIHNFGANIAEFNKIPTAAPITNMATLIRPSSGPYKVYLHTNGHKYWIANGGTFNRYWFDGGKIHVLPPAEVNKIPEGENLNT
jgi:hypothetical protein